jgi:hypothetical protein
MLERFIVESLSWFKLIPLYSCHFEGAPCSTHGSLMVEKIV